MSNIKLIHGSCADQTADAVVNAANSGLKKGGGICKVIFDRCATQHEVEYLMDYMLSLCHTEEFTILFKKLCRGIFPRFPDTVYCYSKYYFEEYEDDYESLVINEKFLRDNKFI